MPSGHGFANDAFSDGVTFLTAILSSVIENDAAGRFCVGIG
jgi:hypothetical protein